jgi:S-DNA-T family DNA segregation ATPase FtsK/SpoIIIE
LVSDILFYAETPHFLEGEFGYWSNKLLVAQIGQAGVGVLIIFLGLTILIIAYNIDFKLPQRDKTSDFVPDVPTDIALDDEIKSEPVEFNVNDRFKNEPKKEQNIVLTPSRFEDKDEEEDLETILPLGTNVLLTPAASAAAATPLEVDEPTFTIEKSEDEAKAEGLVEQFGNYDEKLDLSGYQYPHLDLLENYGSNKISVNADELEANKNKIVETLNHYNIEIDKIKATIGPTVTLYEIIPAPGVRISKIKNLEDDIALSLAALGIRIIAPMPGKGTIGIEVPNQHPEMVSMRSILNTEKWSQNTMDLPIAMGKTISNEVFIADLAKMPHLLVAGATGQGKSVGINAILVSLLFKKHPAQLKFVLVDPKK